MKKEIEQLKQKAMKIKEINAQFGTTTRMGGYNQALEEIVKKLK